MGLEIRKYAAIDIGSNAVRLLVANVIERKNGTTQFRKSSLVRVPVRLGADAFTLGAISKNSQYRMISTMKAFKLLMDVHGVENLDEGLRTTLVRLTHSRSKFGPH